MRAVWCVMLAVLASAGHAQTADISKYFATPAQESADRTRLLADLTAFENDTAPLGGAPAWRKTFDTYSALLIRYRRHGAYPLHPVVVRAINARLARPARTRMRSTQRWMPAPAAWKVLWAV